VASKKVEATLPYHYFLYLSRTSRDSELSEEVQKDNFYYSEHLPVRQKGNLEHSEHNLCHSEYNLERLSLSLRDSELYFGHSEPNFGRQKLSYWQQKSSSERQKLSY